VESTTVHKRRASKTDGTTAFGVRVPDPILTDFEATRIRFRPEVETRQHAIIEAMELWIERQRSRAA
jgi:hypothetical protein